MRLGERDKTVPFVFIKQKEGGNLRLDKYLKVSRIIKRRTVANDACDGGRVKINGVTAKASYEVKEGDIIELSLGQKAVKAQILSISEHALKADAAGMYKIIEE